MVLRLGGAGVFLLAIGCNQSLFDSNPDDRTDAGGQPGDSGAGGDAAPVSSCPAPCAGDALADFSGEQGGSNGRWSYLLDLDAANGADYDPLEFAAWNGLEAWSAGDSGPAIASCAGQESEECAGIGDFILLVPGQDNRPTIAFRAPETASYRLSGAARVADGQPREVAIELLVSRAGRHDSIQAQTVRTSESEVAIAGVIPALEGDEIMVTIGADGAAPALGVRLFFTTIDSGDDEFPGTCQVALKFDDGLEEGCRGASVMDLNDQSAEPPPGPTTTGPGPNNRLGDARVFVEGQYLRVGNSPMNYAGDFTVQFWAKLDEPLPSFASAPYSDWNTVSKGGIAFFLDDDTSYMDVCYMAHGDEVREECLAATRPTDGAWHFWRAVRSEGIYRLCIDGVENVQEPIPAALDMTGDQPPHLGRNVDYEPAYYGGSLDEVRIFAEALPCLEALP
jgi:hypothetical protein